MIITEAAEYLGTTPKKIINELSKKSPEINWTANSEVPEELVQIIESKAQEYQQTAPQVEGKLTVSEAANLVQESIEFGILEAIENYQLSALTYSGQVSAAREIQAYEQGKSSVWEAYFDSQTALAKGQIENARRQAEAFLPAAQAKQATRAKLAQQTADIQALISNLPKLH
jgi:predicted HTH domain antitoxin